MKSSERLNYLNQLKPYTSNPRGESAQVYKNYRNEGMSSYPHMQNYQKTMAELAAEKENEQNIPKQYNQNKLKLEEEEIAKYKGLQTTNEQLTADQQLLQQQVQKIQEARERAQYEAAERARREAEYAVQQRPYVNTAAQKNAQREREAADLIERNRRINAQSQSQQYPPGTQFAPNNWRDLPLGSYHNHVDLNVQRRINQPYINGRYFDYGYQ